MGFGFQDVGPAVHRLKSSEPGKKSSSVPSTPLTLIEKINHRISSGDPFSPSSSSPQEHLMEL